MRAAFNELLNRGIHPPLYFGPDGEICYNNKSPRRDEWHAICFHHIAQYVKRVHVGCMHDIVIQDLTLAKVNSLKKALVELAVFNFSTVPREVLRILRYEDLAKYVPARLRVMYNPSSERHRVTYCAIADLLQEGDTSFESTEYLKYTKRSLEEEPSRLSRRMIFNRIRFLL